MFSCNRSSAAFLSVMSTCMMTASVERPLFSGVTINLNQRCSASAP